MHQMCSTNTPEVNQNSKERNLPELPATSIEAWLVEKEEVDWTMVMEFIPSKEYKKAIKEKDAIVVCAPYSKKQFDPKVHRIGICAKCKCKVIFSEESVDANKYFCPKCMLRYMKALDARGIKYETTSHEHSKGLYNILEERYWQQHKPRTGVAM